MQLVPIADGDDPRIADYRSLTDVQLRRVLEPEGGLYLAESPKVIARALDAGHVPRSVLLAPKWLSGIESLLRGHDVPLYVAEESILESITGFHLHRGAIASMHRPDLPKAGDLLDGARRVVVLEDIADHTNVGAIFRSVAGLGADAVLVTPRCADPLYRRSVRVSMGTVLQVPWTRIPWWPEAAELLHEHGFHIAALALSADAVDLADFVEAAPDRVALVLGTEGDGLSHRAIASADTVVTIPMSRGVDSLNVASAAALALWALS
ncbi:MAG TPA: RNA methyltransferase, partial [Terrimesophilobacter sp.]|nr:RNA methyltransferase [Terrimesophilobacter sp.]